MEGASAGAAHSHNKAAYDFASATSTKHPRQLLQEVSRVLTSQRVAAKPTPGHPTLLKCHRGALRFDLEILPTTNEPNEHQVRFRKLGGDQVAYRDLASRLLTEIRV